MITLKDFLMGREVEHPITDDLLFNAQETIGRVNMLLEKFGSFREVSSGYRPAAINARTPGASPKSKHMTCEAIDLEDVNGELGNWCIKNMDTMKEYGLYAEDPRDTPTWFHLQTVPPKSGKRIFRR
jgi:hypothetical protein